MRTVRSQEASSFNNVWFFRISIFISILLFEEKEDQFFIHRYVVYLEKRWTNHKKWKEYFNFPMRWTYKNLFMNTAVHIILEFIIKICWLSSTKISFSIEVHEQSCFLARAKCQFLFFFAFCSLSRLFASLRLSRSFIPLYNLRAMITEKKSHDRHEESSQEMKRTRENSARWNSQSQVFAMRASRDDASTTSGNYEINLPNVINKLLLTDVLARIVLLLTKSDNARDVVPSRKATIDIAEINGM